VGSPAAAAQRRPARLDRPAPHLTARGISTRLRLRVQPQPAHTVGADRTDGVESVTGPTFGRRDRASLLELDELLTRLERALERQLP